jgi:hypothetical protein
MGHKEWDPVTTLKLAAFAVGVLLLGALIFSSPSGFVLVLDHANLLFHEAGHVFIGYLSRRLEIYGGTIGQLVFPVVLAVSFWRKDQTLPFAAAWIWFFQNWLNIAWYMADARKQALPLVGGGLHDWLTIFTRWDVLAYDTRMAACVQIIGWIGMAAAVGWVVWRAWGDRQRTEAAVAQLR